MPEPMTICVNCKWHRNTSPSKTSDHQYYQSCTCPDRRVGVESDPVLGTHSAYYPCCVTINKGNCETYEPKLSLVKKAKDLLGIK